MSALAGVGICQAAITLRVLKLTTEIVPAMRFETYIAEASRLGYRPGGEEAAATSKPARGEPRGNSRIELTTELSEDVLTSLEDGTRAASEAVRKFVETVDETLALHGECPSRREEITELSQPLLMRAASDQSREWVC